MTVLTEKLNELRAHLLLLGFQKKYSEDINMTEYQNGHVQVFEWHGRTSAEIKLYSHGKHEVTSYFNFEFLLESIREELGDG